MGIQSLRWRSALLEGLGVLAGILLAFAIDAAWDDRQERLRESGYLEALQAELATNRERFQEYKVLLQLSRDGDAYALENVVFAEAGVTRSDIVEMTQRSAGSFLTLPERAALADILSSGGIAFIEDPAVRRLISRYSDVLDQQMATQRDLIELWRGRMAAYYETHASLYDMVGGVEWYGGGLPLDLGSFEVDVDAFVDNREFANLLVHRSILIRLAAEATDRVLDVSAMLSATLDGAV